MVGEFLQPNNSSSLVYSDVELPVGTWIDGRTIYSKTFYVNNPTVNTGHWTFISMTEGMNVDIFIKLEGMVKVTIKPNTVTYEYWQPLPRVVPDDCSSYSIGFGDIDSDRVGIIFGTAYTSIKEIYTTVYYVKGE